MDDCAYELACLIGHEALHEGELREVPFGYDYAGEDDRGFPIWFVDEDLDEYCPLEGIHIGGEPMLN